MTGTLAAWWYARRRGVSFARWADIIAPALFVMQAIGRWGNYFNQELYGPPTTLPWGIPIDCAYRLAESTRATRCPRRRPGSTRCSCTNRCRGLLGRGVPRVPRVPAARAAAPGRPAAGLLHLVRRRRVSSLEILREDNWTFFGVPTAQIVSLAFIAVGVVGLLLRHRASRHAATGRRRIPRRATWGALGAAWMTRPIDEPWANVGDRIDDDAVDDR